MIGAPVVAQLFLLWGIALFGGGVLNVIDATTQLFVAQLFDYPLLSLANSGAGLASESYLTFAFWPRQHEAGPEASETFDAF